MSEHTQSPALHICPQCEGRDTLIVYADKTKCRRCGYVVRGADGKALPPQAKASKRTPETLERRKLKPTYRITYSGQVDRWAKSAFFTGIDSVSREQWDDARKAFQRALETQPDFIDAHLWLAYITDDPDIKEQHLTTVLAHVPGHIEATQEIMILRGDLDATAVDSKDDPHAPANTRALHGAAALESQSLRCPRCGSTEMAVDDLTGLVNCGSCGYVDSSSRKQVNGIAGLTESLLKRRYQPVVWQVGERFLACENCGAQRTIPAEKLSTRCPFCDSTHVFERDAVDSFQQPDGLVQFRIKRDVAKNTILERLAHWTERVKGIFAKNKLKRATIDAVFLPFWIFDAQVNVRKTTIRDNVGIGNSRSSPNRPTTQAGYETSTTNDAIYNVLVCAVKTPSPLLTRKLGAYDLSAAIDYTPKQLARVPAELYSIDFDEASLEARKVIGEEMRQRYEAADYGNTRINVFTAVTQMQFRLLLLPVWVATLYEQDGDMRPALVNGQTGEVVLGKAQKPV